MKDRIDQRVDIDRLGDDRVEARMHCTRAVLGASITGACDRRYPAPLLGRQMPDAPDEFVSILARHGEI